jgi:hypothetical protein
MGDRKQNKDISIAPNILPYSLSKFCQIGDKVICH